MTATMRIGHGNYGRVCGMLSLCLIMATSLPRIFAGQDDDDDDVYRLVLLHTNDMHSMFHQVDKHGSPCPYTDVTKCYGGFARVKTAVDNERKNAENAAVLYLDAGGSIQNTATNTYFKTKYMADLWMKLKPDAMSLGDDEFKNGLVNIQNFIHDINIPIVCSNIDVSAEPLLKNEKNLMNSTEIEIKGRKIGIIGYLTPDTHNGKSEYMGHVKIKPEQNEIQSEVNLLKSRGVNIIIALGHSGIKTDQKIAMEVTDIDVVVGGNSCTFLYKDAQPDIDIPDDSYPIWVEQSSSYWLPYFGIVPTKRVPIVQAFRDTKYLGKLVLEFDKDGNVTKAEGNPILLDHTIEQDPDLLKYLKQMDESIEQLTSSVIGSTSVVLQGGNKFCWTRECNMGNLIVDAFVAHNVRTNIKSFDFTKQWTDASIAFLQSGVMRSNISHTNHMGHITMGDLLRALPLLHDVGKVTVKGSEIRRIIEQAVQLSPERNGEFLQMSGVQLVINKKYQVKTIKVRCAFCLVPVYKKLDLNADYTVIVDISLVTGESDFKFNQFVTKYQSLEITETEILKKEIEIKKLVRPEISGRIIIADNGYRNRRFDYGFE